MAESTSRARDKVPNNASSRALARLQKAHPDDFRGLYDDELAHLDVAETGERSKAYW